MNNVPGPGSYESKYNTTHQPTYTLSKSHRATIDISKNGPGPGDYEPKKIYNTQYHEIGLGKDQRRTFAVKQTSPGPG